MFSKHSIKLASPLYERARAAAQQAGYSSVEEFIAHAVEKELALVEIPDTPEAVIKQLRGLGYLE